MFHAHRCRATPHLSSLARVEAADQPSPQPKGCSKK
jgi:hypothetical protein